jgi:hypothetical protein
VNKVDELHRIEVENLLGFLMVADIDGVAGEAKNIIHSTRVSEEEVGLNCQTVPVSAGYLKDWFAAMFLDQKANPQGRITHHRALVIRHIQSMDFALEKLDMLYGL